MWAKKVRSNVVKLISVTILLLRLQIFQRQINDSSGFFRNWNSYKNGFGDLMGSFWLGNDKVHVISNQREYQLLIEIVISITINESLHYDNFRIGNEESKYRLESLGKYSGSFGM